MRVANESTLVRLMWTYVCLPADVWEAAIQAVS